MNFDLYYYIGHDENHLEGYILHDNHIIEGVLFLPESKRKVLIIGSSFKQSENMVLFMFPNSSPVSYFRFSGNVVSEKTAKGTWQMTLKGGGFFGSNILQGYNFVATINKDNNPPEDLPSQIEALKNELCGSDRGIYDTIYQKLKDS